MACKVQISRTLLVACILKQSFVLWSNTSLSYLLYCVDAVSLIACFLCPLCLMLAVFSVD